MMATERLLRMVDYDPIHSPTDSSSDSVEVKISPICLKKRKTEFSGPLKKRVCLQVKEENQPFRPWSPQEPIALIKPRVPQHPSASDERSESEIVIERNVDTFPGLKQRNYKNMTRERRIEANARERTRVHTISAAFETLRKSIPSYSHNQKLSKLSVLRIACSYIMTLSSIVDCDSEATAECVDLVTKTIQREGKLRKKKDDND